MKFEVVYDAGAVERFHTRRAIRRQTVGEHSWGVAMVLMSICEPSANLLKAAMLHDVPELATGDIPAPFKWAYPDLDDLLSQAEDRISAEWGVAVELTDDELHLLKWADMFELCMYARTEVAMGNRYMFGPLHRGLEYLDNMAAPTEGASQRLAQFRAVQGDL